MNKSDEGCVFSFFEIAQSLITFLIAGKLDGVCSSSTDLKIITIFSIREEKRNFLLQYLWCHRWKKEKEKKRKKTVHSTNEDWSWKISPSLCWNWFVLFFQLSLRIVVSSHDKGIGNFNEQWAKTSHCFQHSNCPLETAEPSRNYARVPGYKKKNTRKWQEKDEKRKEKWTA